VLSVVTRVIKYYDTVLCTMLKASKSTND